MWKMFPLDDAIRYRIIIEYDTMYINLGHVLYHMDILIRR